MEHLVFLSRMGNEIASLEREYVIVTKLYAIARNFELPIPAEELALYQTLMPSFHHLKVRRISSNRVTVESGQVTIGSNRVTIGVNRVAFGNSRVTIESNR